MSEHYVTVWFKRYRRRHGWTCEECGAQVANVEQHASWHAFIAGESKLMPADCANDDSESLIVYVDATGWARRG